MPNTQKNPLVKGYHLFYFKIYPDISTTITEGAKHIMFSKSLAPVLDEVKNHPECPNEYYLIIYQYEDVSYPLNSPYSGLLKAMIEVKEQEEAK